VLRLHTCMLHLLFAGLLFACGSKGTSAVSAPTLAPEHWSPAVKHRLETLVARGAGRGEVAVFDFDNTTLCRDIGEATLGLMSLKGVVEPKTLSRDLSPPFSLRGQPVEPTKEPSLAGLYEKVLAMRVHRSGDLASNAIAYAWAVKMMRGLRVDHILAATEQAFLADQAATERTGTAAVQLVERFPRPFIQPEIADLMGLLEASGYRVYIVSASNVWTVRHLVKYHLNAAIARRHGDAARIPPERVVGVSVLLRDDRTGALVSDRQLVRSNRAYADLEPAELAHYTLTAQIDYPLPAYHGKVANIMTLVGMKRPYLAAGDSSNDFPMLSYSRHRLFISRLEHPGHIRKALERSASENASWLFQGTLESTSPGFVRDTADLAARRPQGSPDAETTRASLTSLPHIDR